MQHGQESRGKQIKDSISLILHKYNVSFDDVYRFFTLIYVSQIDRESRAMKSKNEIKKLEPVRKRLENISGENKKIEGFSSMKFLDPLFFIERQINGYINNQKKHRHDFLVGDIIPIIGAVLSLLIRNKRGAAWKDIFWITFSFYELVEYVMEHSDLKKWDWVNPLKRNWGWENLKDQSNYYLKNNRKDIERIKNGLFNSN